MADSSTPDSVFTGLSYRGVVGLCTLLVATAYRTRSHVSRLYREAYKGFEQALSFCAYFGLVRQREAQILPTHNSPSRTREVLEPASLLSIMTSQSNPYELELCAYLGNFALAGDRALYAAPAPRVSSESPARNFLMEMGVVRFDPRLAGHVVTEEYLWLIAHAHARSSRFSPRSLEAQRRCRQTLGDAAEREVLDFERQRLGASLNAHVVHVAATNVAAGYDIRSVTAISDSVTTPRFIEVKAVSSVDFAFFWSRREMEVAKLLRDRYFLYLLPVAVSGFDLESLQLIQDPVRNVLEPGSSWQVSNDGVHCTQQARDTQPN